MTDSAKEKRARVSRYRQRMKAADAAAECHLASPGPDRWKQRSTTYPGIAEAMADQWGGL